MKLKDIFDKIQAEEKLDDEYLCEIDGGWTWLLSQTAYPEDGAFNAALLSNNGTQHAQYNNIRPPKKLPPGTSGSVWIQIDDGEFCFPLDEWMTEEEYHG